MSIIVVMDQIKNRSLLFKALVGPLTSKQITLSSFGNSIIIAEVRARTMTQSSLYNTQLESLWD